MAVKAGDIQLGYLAAPVLSMLQYILTGSFTHFIVQFLIQIILLNTILRSAMEEAVYYMEPQEFTQTLTQSTNTILALTFFFTLLVHCFQKRAYSKAWESERENRNLEKQKVFLLSFSHELRNLLNTLTGNVRLASLDEYLSEKAKELLRNAEICGELLLHLVNNILDTAKVDIGELEVDLRPTKIYDVLEGIWSICSELIRQQGLRGKMTIQKDIPKTLLVDHYRLTQVFLNIVSNAIKFTDSGSVNITVEWKSGLQEVNEKCFLPRPFNHKDEQDEGLFEKSQVFNVFEDNSLVLDFRRRKIDKTQLRYYMTHGAPGATHTHKGVLKITITDTGCGMPEDAVAQLFNKYTQVTTDPSKRKLGTGLGLFISRQICEKMNGVIRVFSRVDKGSCFIFCLSTESSRDQSETVLNIEAFNQAASNKELKVMIVDDIPFNQMILKSFFDKLGVKVVSVAKDGVEACRNYQRHTGAGERPHIVSMDLDMPIMNGKKASQKIREYEMQEGLDGCCLMIVSGNCIESEIAECLNAEGRIKADSFLKKPTKMEDIMRVIGRRFLNTEIID